MSLSIVHHADTCRDYYNHGECEHMSSDILPTDAPTQLDRIEANSAETLATMKRIETLVTNTFMDVKPTLDSLMEHPMLKMLGMGGKKKT